MLEKYNLVVYGRLIRTVKYELGIKYKYSDLEMCTFETNPLPLEKFDAIFDSIRTLDLVPRDLKESFEDRVLDARNRLVEKLAAKKLNKKRGRKPSIRIKKMKKKKCAIDYIIKYVSDNYHLTVNASMISYVRDSLGVCIKKKDRRYDPTMKNKRIPSQEKYDAIVDAINYFYNDKSTA